jgi:hypothetical protein
LNCAVSTSDKLVGCLLKKSAEEIIEKSNMPALPVCRFLLMLSTPCHPLNQATLILYRSGH